MVRRHPNIVGVIRLLLPEELEGTSDQASAIYRGCAPEGDFAQLAARPASLTGEASHPCVVWAKANLHRLRGELHREYARIRGCLQVRG